MHRMFLVFLDWFVCLSVLHITVSSLRLYFDLCLFSCLFILIVVFVLLYLAVLCCPCGMWHIYVWVERWPVGFGAPRMGKGGEELKGREE